MTEDGRDQRQKAAGPPTVVMQAYNRLDALAIAKMQTLGGRLMTVGLIPLAVSPFVPLVQQYWLFAVMVFLVGVGFYWPPLGMWVLNAFPAAIVKLAPFTKGWLAPDRRSE